MIKDNCKVLVTGANGFVGKALCRLLVENGMPVVAAVRIDDGGRRRCEEEVDVIAVGDIDGNTDWTAALKGVDCVVHLAARVHVMNETAADPLAAFRRVNVAGSEKLAGDAARAGVKRMIYLSSIKVNGEQSGDGPLNERVAHAPLDPYGLSKWEAENSLRQLSAETGMEMVIIRPPLVYGAGVKGNVLTLLGLVAKGLPLPFASVNNKRSLVALRNLVDLIRECIVNPQAAGETFLVSDGDDFSTAELIKVIASGMGKSPRLLPVPLSLLKMGATLTGKGALATRVLSSLQVDSSKVCRVLVWSPPYVAEQEILQVAAWYQQEVLKPPCRTASKNLT